MSEALLLVLLLLVPLVGGLLAWTVGQRSADGARWISVAALVVDLLLLVVLWAGNPAAPGATGGWVAELQAPWIPALGIGFHLGVDGLSLILLALTLALGLVAIATGWTEIRERVGFYHFNLLWVLSGIVGVFMALDLFLFYFFWELMLVPMYFLIGIWGHENRIYAAIKFFLFTQLAGLLMLAAIIALAVTHYAQTDLLTFDYTRLLGTDVAPIAAMWMMLGFFVSFAVKLPTVPIHSWLPDAHTEAPTAGSLILAGLLLKTGAYGLLRFAVPLFPEASADFAPTAMALGAVGIVYGAVLAFSQKDLKRFVAYTSVSHMGFVLLGVYAWNAIALQGVVMQMITHGLSTGGLFILVGVLQERIHTRDIDHMGGFSTIAPRMGVAGLLLALASLGLPGLGNFVAEFLVLLGAFQQNIPATAVACVGLILATVYSLWLVQQAFHGRTPDDAGEQGGHASHFPDLDAREVAIFGVLAIALVWLGLYPQPVLDAAAPALEGLREGTEGILAGAAEAAELALE